MDEKENLTPYDEIMQTKDLQMLKTMIPYLLPQQQRQMAYMITLLELKNAMSAFQNEGSALKMCEIPDGSDRTGAMLSAIRKYFTPKEQETIDMVTNIFYLLNNYDSFTKN